MAIQKIIKGLTLVFIFLNIHMDVFYMDSRNKIEVMVKRSKLRQTNLQVPKPLETFRAIARVIYKRQS